jgi:fused signal recognition particle receptor
MLSFLKKGKNNSTSSESVQSAGLFTKLRSKLTKTRKNFTGGISQLFSRHKHIDNAFYEELETLLLTSDAGIDVTQAIIDHLKTTATKQKLSEPSEVIDSLKSTLLEILDPCSQSLHIPASDSPYVILMIGVNGAGKTTTIGKLTSQLKAEGKSVMLAAGDTFRAAASEQLQAWGERNDVPVISQHSGADSASVIYDALEAAKARNIDILIADTAGRLHTQEGLMAELSKVQRVMQKLDTTAPHEVMLVLDASIGQNALHQAEAFNKTVPITGITMTKLDGTAKGGILFAIAKSLQLPIRFIGVGEGIEDLRAFEAHEFIDAIIEANPKQDETEHTTDA